jgi:ATP-dependent helicase IRC3
VFQQIVFHRSVRDMIEAGYLSRLRAIRVQSDTNLDEVHSVAGDFDQGELAEAVDNDKRNKLIVKAIKEHCATRKGVIFTVTVQHAVDVAALLEANGRRAAAISGSMPKEERRRILKEFHEGKIQDLVNCMILTEGFDEPGIEYVVHAKPTKSSLLYIQMTGRGTRLAPGKKDCLIIDIVDVTLRHSLVTLPDLFGLPAGFDAQGDDILNVVKRAEDMKKATPQLSMEGAKNLDDLKMRAEEVDLFATAANLLYNDEVKKHAKLLWMCEGEDHYSMRFSGEFRTESVDLKQNLLGQWEISHNEFKPTPIGDAGLPDLPTAFAAAEDWIRQNRPDVVRLKSQNARWRKDPASDGQLNFLRGHGIKVDQQITKGQANDLIEAFKMRHRR